MTPAAFQDLAFRALENPGDAKLRAELERALAEYPAYRAEWTEMSADYALAAEVFSARLSTETVEATDRDPRSGAAATIPPERLAALRQLPPPTRAAARPRRAGWIWPAAIAAALMVGFFSLRPALHPAGAPDLSAWRDTGPVSLRAALNLPMAQLLAKSVLPVQRGDGEPSLTLRSPLVAAQAGPVDIAWSGSSAPEPTTVILRQHGTERWRTQTTGSRVTTPALPADDVFAVEINPPGATALTEEFVTVAPSPTSQHQHDLDGVLAAATASPARLGEAVLAWWTLPAAIQSSESGIRVGLWLGVEARQPDLLAEARQAAQRN